MEKNMTLLIMAAGMGSRFGGLKQIETVGPTNEFIIDYSVYDAIVAGFNKVVFVIKEENYDIFRDTIGKRIEPYINVEYCFQSLKSLPNDIDVPEGREKPWGTAHAILAAKEVIHENFAIINADDFYGREAFIDIANFLKRFASDNKYAVVGYEVEHTLTEHGSVKRAVLEQHDDVLCKLIESTIEKKDGVIVASPLNGAESFVINRCAPVSMNMFGFSPSIFKYIEENFIPFLEKNKDNILKCEYLIPELVAELIGRGIIDVSVIPTKSRWQGVTYKEDTPKVMKMIENEIEMGKYKRDLWEDFKLS